MRLRLQRTNHVWSYGFVSAKTHDGRTVRILNLIDEHIKESLLVRPERRWSIARVIEALADVMMMKGDCEFLAKDLRRWLADIGAKTLSVETWKSRQNGYSESFNSKFRDEFLNGEISYSLKEVQVRAERWRVHYNKIWHTRHWVIAPRRQKPGRLNPISRDVKSRELPRTSQLVTPVRQPSMYIKSCAKLTINLEHKIGQAVRVNCP